MQTFWNNFKAQMQGWGRKEFWAGCKKICRNSSAGTDKKNIQNNLCLSDRELSLVRLNWAAELLAKQSGR